MSDDYDETQISDQEKIRIVTDFILHAPPGEFKEVFNDVRALLNNDTLLKEHAPGIFAQYSKDQLAPVKVENSEYGTLITEHNELNNGRFYDPRTKQSFKFDHLKEEASDYMPWSPDTAIESWRAAVENQWATYCKNHYPTGNAAVFGSVQKGLICLTMCIEHHEFQPKNYWNGRWRSEWTISFPPEKNSGKHDLIGVIKVQVHYYEDGNVQLVSKKENKGTVNVTDEEQTAKDIVQFITNAETDYQSAVTENYQTMSDTTFKALRRQLPVAKQKIDWNKLLTYKIGSELKHH